MVHPVGVRDASFNVADSFPRIADPPSTPGATLYVASTNGYTHVNGTSAPATVINGSGTSYVWVSADFDTITHGHSGIRTPP